MAIYFRLISPEPISYELYGRLYVGLRKLSYKTVDFFFSAAVKRTPNYDYIDAKNGDQTEQQNPLVKLQT